MVRRGTQQKAKDKEMLARHMRHLEKEAILDKIREAYCKADEKHMAKWRTSFTFPTTSNISSAIIELYEHCRRYNG